MRLVLGLPGLQEAPKLTGQLVILAGAAGLRWRLEIQSRLVRFRAFLGITGAFCLGGEGTFGQGPLGHKTAHLEVMPRAGAIFCGVLPNLAVASHAPFPACAHGQVRVWCFYSNHSSTISYAAKMP